MTIPTASELTLLRTRPQQTRLWLSIYKPTIIMACQVNNPLSTVGDRLVIYDGAPPGVYLNIKSGMTMLVGTTLGGSEKGKIRVRSATNTVLTVAENSHIDWDDDDYLTILNFYEITAIYPRIIIDPANTLSTIWYKDYDIAYTNQNDILGSNICMGSHFAGFLEDGFCQVYYSATGTYNFLGEPLVYDWQFEGAVTPNSSDYIPGYIAYDTPGYYTTCLTVSGTVTGAVDVSYRHISIYDRPENGVNTPILQWEMEDIQGSRDAGGYTTRIKVFDNIADIMDNALVVIFSENWYGDTKQSIGGNASNRNNIIFCGYITKDSIQYNYKDSFVEFDVGSPIEIMKQIEGFSVAMNSSPNPSANTDKDIPSKWVLIKDMDIKRGIYHYLRWHSTALLCNDFEFRGVDQYVEYFDSDRTSLYDAIQTFINSSIIGALVSDKQGKLWAEVDISATPNVPTAFPTTLVLSKQDWMEEPVIDERKISEVSFIEMGGMSYSTGTHTSTAYLSCAPGTVPGYGGKNEQIEGLAFGSQTELNTLVGNVYAYKNSRYPNIPIKLSQNFNNLDIAPQELIKMNVVPADTVRGITMTDKPFALRSLSWTYDPEKQIILPSIELSEVTVGFNGTTIPIPPVPPTGGEDGGGYSTPPIVIPNLPSFTFPPTISIVHMPIVTYELTGMSPSYLVTPFNGIPFNLDYFADIETTAPKTSFNAELWVTFYCAAGRSAPFFTQIQYMDYPKNPVDGFLYYATLLNYRLVDIYGNDHRWYAHCKLFTIPHVAEGDVIELQIFHMDESTDPLASSFWSAGAYLVCP